MTWTAADHRSAAKDFDRKAAFWQDRADRHQKKCEKCAEEIRRGWGLGCSVWHDSWMKAEQWRDRASGARSLAYQAEREDESV